MNQIEFQHEAKQDKADSISLASIMVGLRLRGYLTESDRISLDQVGDSLTQLFLMQGNTCHHPAAASLFPFGTIEASVITGGAAIFTHRYRADSDLSGDHCIRTALIDYASPEPLLLGSLERYDRLTDQAAEDRFCHLLNEFRDALRMTDDSLTDLRANLQSRKPKILIDSISGRLVKANDPAVCFFDLSEREMLDRKLNQLNDNTEMNRNGLRIRIDDVGHPNLNLSIATLNTSSSSAEQHEEHLLHQFQPVDRCTEAITSDQKMQLAENEPSIYLS